MDGEGGASTHTHTHTHRENIDHHELVLFPNPVMEAGKGQGVDTPWICLLWEMGCTRVDTLSTSRWTPSPMQTVPHQGASSFSKLADLLIPKIGQYPQRAESQGKRERPTNWGFSFCRVKVSELAACFALLSASFRELKA